MKKWLILFLLTIIATGAYFGPRYYTRWQWQEDKEVCVFIFYNKKNLEAASFIADAYQSVLEEEGVPHRFVEAEEIIDLDAQEIARRIPAIILPEYIMQVAPDGLDSWLKEYLEAGGNIAIIYDAATFNDRGRFLRTALLADLTGINYILAYEDSLKAYDNAKIQFSSQEALDFFQITPGKAVKGTTLGDIGIDEAKFQVAHNRLVHELPESSIYAYALTDSQEKVPALTLTEYGNGKILYVNMLLGFLKANTNDLYLRSIMRTFLFDIAKTPHFVNVENGIGTLIINWGVYLRMEDFNLQDKIDQGYFRKDVNASIHIAAGDFLHAPGDNRGFDAVNRGNRQAHIMAQYGTLGSLGGWAHNWSVKQMELGVLDREEIKENITRNNQALQNITGYEIKEYSAPGGLHHQPIMTRIIEELGMNSYLYYGDYGSNPNRTFTSRKKVSDNVIAFPIASYGKFSNLWDYQQFYADTDDTILEWLEALTQFVENKKVARTFFMNEHDIFYYPKSIASFMNYLSEQEEDKKLVIVPMSHYAEFLKRFLQTQYTFNLQGNTLNVEYENKQGLQGILLALPKDKYGKPEDISIEVQEDENYYYIKAINEDEQQKNISVTLN